MDIILSPNRIFIAFDYTDMRKSIDGPSDLLSGASAQLNVFDSVTFPFCGRKRDYSKALLLKGDGFFSCISAWKAAIDHADTELIKHD